MDIHLEQSNSLIQTLIGRLPVGILYCDFDETFTIEGANEGLFRLTGFMEPDLEERFHNQPVCQLYIRMTLQKWRNRLPDNF